MKFLTLLLAPQFTIISYKNVLLYIRHTRQLKEHHVHFFFYFNGICDIYLYIERCSSHNNSMFIFQIIFWHFLCVTASFIQTRRADRSTQVLTWKLSKVCVYMCMYVHTRVFVKHFQYFLTWDIQLHFLR